jgi:NTP pyrophosphatase (non-canonical NTP hydrolase)
MKIKELVKSAHENAVNKGFWDLEIGLIRRMREDKNYKPEEVTAVINAFRSQKLMLIVSELGEAQEALRKNDWLNYKEELADVVIRMGDLAGGEDIRLETEIVQKMDYNKSRPYLHGKTF